MMKLERLQTNAAIRGIVPDALVTVVSVQWFGSEALELTYKTAAGRVANELLYRHDEPRLELVEQGRPWSFDGDGALFRLVSEAQRIRLAHLFDPVLAVHTSVVDPLPHQITAVYETMLPRQPLRFLLADDPGAAAARYNLPRLAENIEDEPNNTTRFLVLGKHDAGPSGRDKTSLIMSAPNRTGALHELLLPFASAGVSMSRLESRPARHALWEYVFYVDVDGHRDDPAVKAALDELAGRAAYLKILGSYPVAVY